MHRKHGVWLLLAGIVISTAAFAPPNPPKRRLAAPTSRKADRAKPIPRNLAVDAMRKIIKNADFKDMPFEEFVEWLERTTKATVIVRWKRLDEAGIQRDQPISLRFQNVPLRKIIEIVLDQLERDDPAVRLAAKADDNLLILSTEKDLFREMITRTYDIQDLIQVIPNFYPRYSPPSYGIGPGIAAGPDGVYEDDYPLDEEKAQQLIELITSHVRPESWRVNGGEGAISFFRGRLIVTNNLLVHEELGGGTPPTLKTP